MELFFANVTAKTVALLHRYPMRINRLQFDVLVISIYRILPARVVRSLPQGVFNFTSSNAQHNSHLPSDFRSLPKGNDGGVITRCLEPDSLQLHCRSLLAPSSNRFNLQPF